MGLDVFNCTGVELKMVFIKMKRGWGRKYWDGLAVIDNAGLCFKKRNKIACRKFRKKAPFLVPSNGFKEKKIDLK